MPEDEDLMTEPVERVSHIERLPILYTPQMVLLPFEFDQKLKIGKPAPLQMLKDAIHADKMFGVSYLDEDDKPVLDRPPIGSCGTIARIDGVNLSRGGKIVKLTGIARYRVEEYIETDKPYPIAEVSFFKDEPETEFLLIAQSLRLGLEIKRIMDKVSQQLGASPIKALQLNPIPMSFVMADLFDFPAETRLEFLQTRSTVERFAVSHRMLKQFEAAAADIDERERFTNIYKHLPHDPQRN